MRMLDVGVLLTLVACTVAAPSRAAAQAQGAAKAPAFAPRPPVGPPAPSCVPVGTDGHLAVDALRIDADQVGLCVASTPRTCWRVDLATGAYASARDGSIPAPAPPAPPTAAVQADGSVQLCPSPATCVVLRPRGRKPAADARWSVSADGKRAAMVAASQRSLELYDVATGKRTARIRAWRTPMGNPSYLDDPTFAGDRVIAWIHETPVSSKGRVFTLTGKKLGDVGGKDFSQNTVDAWALDGSQWAFKQLDDARLIVVDLKTATQVRGFDLAPLGVAAGNPEDLAEPAGVAAFGDRLVYVAAAAVPVVAVLDRKTGAVQAFPAPRCP